MTLITSVLSSASGDIAGQIWAFIGLLLLREAGAVAVGLIVFGLFVLIAALTDEEGVAVVGVVVAWLAAIVWQLLALWWIISDVVAFGQQHWGWS
jgi:threonine/homoserine efflux transporter RhtA